MNIEPYLFFEGRCEEAVKFYEKACGATVEMLMRMKDAPPDPQHQIPAAMAEKVLHASFMIGSSRVMASDGMCSSKAAFAGVALSITVASEAECQRVFAGLSEGGEVKQPLGKTFFATSFGMVNDQFGVQWMVILPAPMPA